jgi:hypothetical protein
VRSTLTARPVRSPRQLLWSPSSTRSSRARSGRSPRLGRPVDDDQVLVGHIAEQDPDDAEGKVKPCGDLGDRQDLVAEGGDGPLLRGQLRGLLPGGGRGDQRLDLQVVVSGRVRPPVIAYAELVAVVADRRGWSWRCLTWPASHACPARLLLASCSCWTTMILDGLRRNGGRSRREGGLELGPQAGGEDIPGAADQHGHLIGDHPHVAGGADQHR